MDNTFRELVDDVIASINDDSNSDLTQLKIHSILELINELGDLPPHLYFIVLFLLASSHCKMNEETRNLYLETNRKIAIFLLDYNYFPLHEKDVIDYYDPNLANAIGPLTELSANIHKNGDIIHFVERKYMDSTGRKFIGVDVPDYNEQQSLLQFRLNELLKSN